MQYLLQPKQKGVTATAVESVTGVLAVESVTGVLADGY